MTLKTLGPIGPRAVGERVKTKAKRPGPLSIHSINDTIPAHHKGKATCPRRKISFLKVL
jgi:hypothetical protein